MLQALVNNALTWQSSCVIANNAGKTAKATCPSNKVVKNTVPLLNHMQARFISVQARFISVT